MSELEQAIDDVREIGGEYDLDAALRILEELRDFRAEGGELERQACALVKQYGMVLMMAPPAKAFFKRLAVFMKWTNLEKML